jgi:hypothetical protein
MVISRKKNSGPPRSEIGLPGRRLVEPGRSGSRAWEINQPSLGKRPRRGRDITMNDRIPMFPTAQPSRADEDTAAIEQVIEQVPGEIELDKIIKAQTSAPQIVKRMVELENSIWSLVGILLLLPQDTRDKIGATEAIEQPAHFSSAAW